jgi:hypothetical protein
VGLDSNGLGNATFAMLALFRGIFSHTALLLLTTLQSTKVRIQTPTFAAAFASVREAAQRPVRRG